MRRRLSYANVTATLALFIALGGSSYAALKLPKNSVTTVQVKNGSLLAKDFKKGQVKRGRTGADGAAGAPGEQGLRGIGGPAGALGPIGPAGLDGAPGAPGADGTAKAYAYIGGPGTVGMSKGITQAMVTRTAGNAIGVYCLHGLGFEPKNGQVTPDGLSGSQNISATIDVPSNGGPCGFLAATIEIRYMAVNFATKVVSYPHIDHGFYLELN